MLKPCGVALFAMALFGTAGDLYAQSVFETKIIALNPCSALRQGSGLLEVRIDRVDLVRIDEFSLVLRGDVITAAVRGALSCKTSDAALLPGSVGADVAISATLPVTDCPQVSVQASLSNINGFYGEVLKAFQGEAEGAIAEGARDQLVKSCQGLAESLAP